MYLRAGSFNTDEVRKYEVVGIAVFRHHGKTAPVLLLRDRASDNLGLILNPPQVRQIRGLLPNICDFSELCGYRLTLEAKETGVGFKRDGKPQVGFVVTSLEPHKASEYRRVAL
ncbi:MAG TPA: hypothetical protein VGV89_09565 [Thermoplasmata archaeon]|nr:hypothetical protein [Thermoplasmata archaeon]